MGPPRGTRELRSGRAPGSGWRVDWAARLPHDPEDLAKKRPPAESEPGAAFAVPSGQAILATMSGSEHVFDPTALQETEDAASGPEVEFERTLRPSSLDEFVGQERTTSNLRVAIDATRARSEPLDHVLLSGPPGLGKTSLARLLARELDTDLHSTSGPALVAPKDLVGILTNLKRGDVLFIDEIHRVPKVVEEYLYAAMEDFTIDFTLETGPNARILDLKLEQFTLVGATTREGLLSAPFRGRFGLSERLTPYTNEELARIVKRSAGLLSIEISDEARDLIAERSRGTPRITNRFLRRARDLAQVAGANHVELDMAAAALERLGVDAHGLEEMDRRILHCLSRNQGTPLGLKTIAATIGESEDTIEEVFEPHLLRCGFLQKTGRGRMLTEAGAKAIGTPFIAPRSAPGRLFEE